jgi:hypothetical protein
MTNGYDLKVTGDKLVLTIDLTHAGKLSSTGKTMLVSTSNGALAVGYPQRPGMKISWNLMAPR